LNLPKRANIIISMTKIRYLILLGILMLLGACEMNRLRSVEEHYEKGRYAAAIQETDDMILKTKNRALVTRAELVRSNSYHQLGLIAQERSTDLAIRFFKLANSPAADKDLAKIYKARLMDAALTDDYETQLEYISTILREMPASELVPEMMQRRINIYLDRLGDSEAAWQDYMDLFDGYEGNSHETVARKTIQRIVPNKIAYGKRLAEAKYYNDAFTVYFELAKYPVIASDEINEIIGNTYRAQAEDLLEAGNYSEAEIFLRIALQYVPHQRSQIEARMRGIVDIFIVQGDNYVKQRNYEQATQSYQRVFEIIPDYKPALDAIQRMHTAQDNIVRAAQLFAQAERAEASGKVADALSLYRQADALDSTQETRNRIAISQNTLEADRNPLAFAKKIVNEYRGGLLNTRINNRKQELQTRYKKNEIRDSGWKFLHSTSQYKYEVRYDLITPRETFLYVWQVNLKDRSIIPLNKISEDLMK